jgi:hypothetical protein
MRNDRGRGDPSNSTISFMQYVFSLSQALQRKLKTGVPGFRDAGSVSPVAILSTIPERGIG